MIGMSKLGSHIIARRREAETVTVVGAVPDGVGCAIALAALSHDRSAQHSFCKVVSREASLECALQPDSACCPKT